MRLYCHKIDVKYYDRSIDVLNCILNQILNQRLNLFCIYNQMIICVLCDRLYFWFKLGFKPDFKPCLNRSLKYFVCFHQKIIDYQ